MFGYVNVNRPEMKVRDLELYRGYYCGLCHELHERYGRRGQLLLSYDAAFLAVLLSGLYEPEEDETRRRCVVHPAVRHLEVTSPYTRYAADMNVMLAYRKALDDWQDDRKHSARLTAFLLYKDYCRLRVRYRRQERALSVNIRALRKIESQGRVQAAESGKDDISYSEKLERILKRIELTAGCTGNFFGEICVPRRDHWEKDLRETGFYLGKFISLMDAYDDLDSDEKSGSFNVLSELKALEPERFETILKEILTDTAACCCRAFERLPIIRDVELLRNILYSGIWIRFTAISAGENEKNSKGGPVGEMNPAGRCRG